MGIFSNFWDKVTGTEKVEVRARNKKGHYVADDKSTPNVNEAYTTKRVKKKAKITTQNIG
jgi:sterol desaturase/sphingolipid hydroxylase (fatty acid hydroxylase superfamily)